MRRKPMQGGGRPNHGGGHGGHGGGQRRNNNGGGYNNNRPRKNYPQLREKYLQQAKDALSGGDRVMAEYYFQHADHCYRMMMEEGYRPNNQNQQENAPQDGTPQDGQAANAEQPAAPSAEDSMPDANALPSFLTMGYTAAAGASNTDQAAANPNQGQWEEN